MSYSAGVGAARLIFLSAMETVLSAVPSRSLKTSRVLVRPLDIRVGVWMSHSHIIPGP